MKTLPRPLLTATAALILGLVSAAAAPIPGGWDKVDPAKPKQVLYFTKSAGFEHSVVKRSNATELAYSEKILAGLGASNRFQVTCTKDGAVFTPENLAKYDVFVFYTSGLLTEPGTDKQPAMTPAGKAALLQAIRDGKGFVGLHSASDSFHHQPDAADKSARFVSYRDTLDPYVAMLGAEFIRHGPQQSATLIVVDNRFPGVAEIKEDRCTLHEEWYTFKDFALDMHVLLAQVTQGMKGVDYRRANYPNTWARLEGKGRVYYTGMGHREDVWTNPLYQKLLLGAIGWAAGNVTADVTPNLEKATPGHREIQPREDPNAAPKKAKK